MLIVLPTLTLSSASPQAPKQDAPSGILDSRVIRGGRTRLLIDGKNNPELVNRDLLVAQILGSMALPESATKKDERRLHFMAAAIGLGRRDEQLLRREMIRLNTAIAPIKARLKANTRSDGAPQEVPIADLNAYRGARLQS